MQQTLEDQVDSPPSLTLIAGRTVSRWSVGTIGAMPSGDEDVVTNCDGVTLETGPVVRFGRFLLAWASGIWSLMIDFGGIGKSLKARSCSINKAGYRNPRRNIRSCGRHHKRWCQDEQGRQYFNGDGYAVGTVRRSLSG